MSEQGIYTEIKPRILKPGTQFTVINGFIDRTKAKGGRWAELPPNWSVMFNRENAKRIR